MGRKIYSAGGTFALTDEQQRQAEALFVRAVNAGGGRAVADQAYWWVWERSNDPRASAAPWFVYLVDDATCWDNETPAIYLRIIAPAVPKGQFLVCRDEEGDHWRYLFDGTGCTIQEGSIVFFG